MQSNYCSYIGRIRVKGYNTQFSHDDVVNALRKLFSSCGEITDVYISVLADNTLNRFLAPSSSVIPISTKVYLYANFYVLLFHTQFWFCLFSRRRGSGQGVAA